MLSFQKETRHSVDMDLFTRLNIKVYNFFTEKAILNNRRQRRSVFKILLVFTFFPDTV